MSDAPPELVDNRDRYGHGEALRWLAAHREAPMAVATGYVRLGGLVALASLPGRDDRPMRLLLGAMPEPGLGALPLGEREPRLAGERFSEALERPREERDFEAFPESRRAALEQVDAFVRTGRVQVRRYTSKFLHGKTYIFGHRGSDGDLDGEGAVLVTSANLTSGGLEHNLELGMVRYDPSPVTSALDWYDELWAEADEFKDDLLNLLVPPREPFDPMTIFQRALIELYGEEIEREAGEIVAGGVTLTRFQEDGYRRARRILEELGGVIYADGVGTGKTEIGLRFVTEYAKERGVHALIVTPAQLRETLWERRLLEAGLPGQVVSYQELATDRQLTPGGSRRLHLDKDAYRLVIVDEAHAFRNHDNTWYAALDRIMGGTPKALVLLTATPVNNTLWDLHNLLLLFARHDAAFRHTRLAIPSLRETFIRAGAHDPDQINEELLFPLVDAASVRRDRRFLQERYAGDTFPDGTPVRFPAPLLEEVRYDLDAVYPGVFQDVVDQIEALTMARYVPSKYERLPSERAREEALAGLLKSQLLKRFESSSAAARETLQRMILAHEALVEAWTVHGRVPSLATLKDLVRAVHEGDPLPELVSASLDEDTEVKPAPPSTRDFWRMWTPTSTGSGVWPTRWTACGAPRPQARSLATILSRTEARKVAVFCSYADTARHVAEAIQLDPARFGTREMSLVVGTEADATERMRQLERFCPKSVTGDPEFEPPDGEVDLLISTDILSEGQNLQDAQAVVSFDLPWNPQRVVQRNGRIIRLKSDHERVFLFTMLPKQGDLEAALRLEARVRGKIAAANATFGMETQVLEGVEAAMKAYADEAEGDTRRGLEEFFRRLEEGDETLLDEGQAPGSGAFAGEQYRWILSRLLQEGTLASLRRLPWGVGSAFARPDLPAEAAGVFFACRTNRGERQWRFVSFGGEVIREDLRMLRLIDPGDRPRAELPDPSRLEQVWSVAAEDICRTFNERLDPKRIEAALPASQRWALEVLRNPDLPDDPSYANADEALGVGRNQLVRRALSEVRRRMIEGEVGLKEAAEEITSVVEEFGLRPEPIREERAEPITEADLGVVCFQVVLSE